MTFQKRLVRFFNLYSIAAFLAVLGLSVFIALSLEDAIFNQILSEVVTSAENNQTTQAPFRSYSQEEWQTFSDGAEPGLEYGEISRGDQHYHYRRAQQGDTPVWVVLNVTELSVISKAKYQIALLYAPLLLLLLFLSTIVARRVSNIAVRPFQRLLESFGGHQLESLPSQDFKDVAETDIRHLALNFQSIIQEKHAFYQGISHELRTPIQIMKNTITLLSMDHPQMQSNRNLVACQKSINRMERISEAFLWLTHDGGFGADTNVNESIERVLAELEPVLNGNQIDCRVVENAPLFAPMPAVVMELIIFNLASNAIAHAGAQTLTIKIDKDTLAFINAMNNEHQEDGAGTEGFNIGLSLVRKLARRFGAAFDTETGADSFLAQLRFDQAP